MRAHSQEDRVPTELDIEGGYQGMLDVTGHQHEASAEALVDTVCGGHRQSHLKPGLGEYQLPQVPTRQVQ